MISGNLNFLEPSGPLQACNRTALPLHLFHPEALSCSSLSLFYTEDRSVMAHRNTACVCTPWSRQLSQLSCNITAIPVNPARPYCCTIVLFCRQLHADDDCSAPPIHHRRQRSWQWFSEGEDSAGRHGEYGAAHNEPTARADRHGYVRHRASNTRCCLRHFLAFLILLSVPQVRPFPSCTYLLTQYSIRFTTKTRPLLPQ